MTARRSRRASSPIASAIIRTTSKSHRVARPCHDFDDTTFGAITSPRSRGEGALRPLRDGSRNTIEDACRFRPAFGQKSQRGDLMTYIAKPKFQHPGIKKNTLGYSHRDYEGKISTL